MSPSRCFVSCGPTSKHSSDKVTVSSCFVSCGPTSKHSSDKVTVSSCAKHLSLRNILLYFAVFSAGVGVWMDTVDRENNVTSFANNIYHYACAEHWTSMIKTETTKVENTNGRSTRRPHC